MEHPIIAGLIAGYILDLLLGDPRWIPHPIVAFGNSISFLEKKLNKGTDRFFKGLVAGLLLPLIVFGIFYVFQYGIALYFKDGLLLFNVVFVFFGIANRSLLQEGSEVISELEKNGIEAGRKRLSWIVGRDTSELSPQQIYKAVFETLSENLSDGVVAPLFYYAIGGVPGIMAYKMINTLDSMIGYKSERYFQFGKFSARLDDVANYIPARLTALLMAALTGSWRAIIFIKKYARKHTSPNAGFPESALAGILNCQFGGPNVYHGVLVEKPFIGENDRILTRNDFKKLQYINHSTTFVSIILIVLFYLLVT